MRYVASPLLTFLEGVHDASLADEDAPAAPGQQDCPFRVRDRGHARRTSGQLSRARRLLATPGGLPTTRLQRAATLNPRRHFPRTQLPTRKAYLKRQRCVTTSPEQEGQIAE
jgi:hypothetical protein